MLTMRRVLLLMLGVTLLAGAVVAATGLWFRYAVYGDRSLPQSETHVVIPRGATAADVGRLLAERGVIGQARVFQLLARLRHVEAEVKAGEYRFAAHQPVDETLRQVVVGGEQIAVWVTIPEGFTLREIAQTLAEHSLGDAAAYRTYFESRSLDLGGVKTRGLEGYLFPNTYLIPTNARPETVAKIMTGQFLAVLPRDATLRARRLGLTVPQVVTLASLIEREAKSDDERRLMAGVYYNRLRLGMPLEVDATIEYTFAHHKDVITFADLARESPYNTYKHPGLPPTPIANPGRPSLEAAFDPQKSDYLYYVYKGNGHHAFSRTLAEHNANVARYLH